jgi:uncharacterized protein (DUF1778 family)
MSLFKREKRSVTFVLKLTPSERCWLSEAAGKKNLNVSEFILTALDSECQRLSQANHADRGFTEFHADEAAERAVISDFDWLDE